MTVSNIVSPVMVSLDRFLIGATTSMAAVAYYATPYEMITKLWIIPTALMGVLFPALSTALVSDRQRASRLFRRGVAYTFALMFPVVLAVVTLADPGLNAWLGAEFARNSAVILQILAVGVLINSLAHLPFGLIQADGRPDLTAKLHLIELPIYLLALWFFLNTMGIVGAAVAWTLRVTVDTIVLFVMAKPRLDTSSRGYPLAPFVAASFPLLIVGGLLTGLLTRLLVLVASEGLFLLAAWRWLIPKGDFAIVWATVRRQNGS
jgi:O-antigen/teichoic acid export membrane protein